MSQSKERALEVAIEQVRRVRGLRREKREKPHKLILLLAVLDLIEDGIITRNRIYLNKQLEERFSRYFVIFADEDDWCQIGPPFFHLRSSGFWFHKVKEHRETTYSIMHTPGGGRKNILRNIDYAYFSEEFFGCVMNPSTRAILRNVVIARLMEMSSNPLRLSVGWGLKENAGTE